MEGPLRSRGTDAEGVMIALRFGAALFALVQTATYYRPFPPDVLPWAWACVVAAWVSAIVLGVWWLRVRGSCDPRAQVRLAVASLAADVLLAVGMTWTYAFDPDTAIFVVMYVVAVEGAFRFGMRGAVATMLALGALYAAREVWAWLVYGHEIFVVSITFRIGVGLMIAIVAGAMSDRSEREHRRLQAALRREREVATSLRSLDELRSTFLAAVSHELRTPLTSILGFSLTISQRASELSPGTRVMLDQVVAESRHLEQLLQDLLDIERMGRGSVVLDRRVTDLAALVAARADRLQRRTGRRIDVDVDGVTGVLDGVKVERILDNLLGNAVKYSPEQAPVTVHAERSGDGVLLVVDDEGPGVPPALRGSIFAPFERGQVTSAHQPGTGIGLSLVDQFARLHGGRAWVEDRAGPTGGASFRVYLPDGPEGETYARVVAAPRPSAPRVRWSRPD